MLASMDIRIARFVVPFETAHEPLIVCAGAVQNSIAKPRKKSNRRFTSPGYLSSFDLLPRSFASINCFDQLLRSIERKTSPAAIHTTTLAYYSLVITTNRKIISMRRMIQLCVSSSDQKLCKSCFHLVLAFSFHLVLAFGPLPSLPASVAHSRR